MKIQQKANGFDALANESQI